MPWISRSYAYLGLAHFWRCTWQEALDNFQEAGKLCTLVLEATDNGTPVPWFGSGPLRIAAGMLIERDAPGDRDKARELLTDAISMYRQIGVPNHVEMAENFLAEVCPLTTAPGNSSGAIHSTPWPLEVSIDPRIVNDI